MVTDGKKLSTEENTVRGAGMASRVELALFKYVKFLVCAFIIFIWAFIGFLFWVPLLARATLFYSGGVLLAAIAEGDAAASNRQMDNAIKFYLYGFHTVLKYLKESMETLELHGMGKMQNPQLNFRGLGFKVLRVLVETIYVLAFWYVVVGIWVL